MMRNRCCWIFLFIVLIGWGVFWHGVAAAGTSYEVKWVGQYPYSSFNQLPAVQLAMHRLLDGVTLAKINDPVGTNYVTRPIDFVLGYYVIWYAQSRGSLNANLVIVIDQSFLRGHAAVRRNPNALNGEPGPGLQWTHFGENELPLPLQHLVEDYLP